jgi:hypothetical protein
MLTTRLCAGSVVPMEDRALSLSLSTVLRDLRDEHPQVHAGVLNLQGAVYRTIVVDGLRQYRALRVCFGRLGYSHGGVTHGIWRSSSRRAPARATS